MGTNLSAAAGPGGLPQRKKTSPLVWILIGAAVFMVLVVVLFAGLVLFGIHKAKQAGLDPDLIRRNPGVAAAKLLAAMNPDAEVVKVDEGRGTITVRDKRTGKIVTMNFEDIRRGKLTFEDETGKVAIGGGGVQLPSWLPAYAGARLESDLTAEGETGHAGAFHFTTTDSAERVLAFYEAAFKSAGLAVNTVRQEQGGVLTGRDEGEQRAATVTVGGTAAGSTVTVNFKSK